MNHDADIRLDLFIQAVLERKAEAIVALDVRDLTSIADTFIICSGRSSRQVSAIAEHVERFLKDNGIRPLSVDGRREGHWVLMDYGDIIVHVFYEETRNFYDLEGLWVDAKRIASKRLEDHRHPAEPFDGEEIIID
jgi:ribosome-associated protein